MKKEPIQQLSAAIMLDSETYFDKYKIMKNTAMRMTNSSGFTPNKTPALVATALPPLNLR